MTLDWRKERDARKTQDVDGVLTQNKAYLPSSFAERSLAERVLDLEALLGRTERAPRVGDVYHSPMRATTRTVQGVTPGGCVVYALRGPLTANKPQAREETLVQWVNSLETLGYQLATTAGERVNSLEAQLREAKAELEALRETRSPVAVESWAARGVEASRDEWEAKAKDLETQAKDLETQLRAACRSRTLIASWLSAAEARCTALGEGRKVAEAKVRTLEEENARCAGAMLKERELRDQLREAKEELVTLRHFKASMDAGEEERRNRSKLSHEKSLRIAALEKAILEASNVLVKAHITKGPK